MQKSPQLVKHVVKVKMGLFNPQGREEQPIMFIAKMRDFKRFGVKIKENLYSIEPPILL